MEKNVNVINKGDQLNINDANKTTYNTNNKIIIHTKSVSTSTKIGRVAIGYIIYFDDGHKYKYSRTLGFNTNIGAEYKAIMFALLALIKKNIKAKEVILQSDSQSVVNQILGNQRIKEKDIIIKKLNNKVKRLLIRIAESGNIEKIKFQWISSEQNKEVKKLVKKVLGISLLPKYKNYNEDVFIRRFV